MRTRSRDNPKLPEHPPVWAETFGEDQYGLFAECAYQGVAFVFRWIPPGRFRMGALLRELDTKLPVDEQPQHEVTISEGFWLGETPVTKVQWEILAPARLSDVQLSEYSKAVKEKLATEDLIRVYEKLERTVETLNFHYAQKAWLVFKEKHAAALESPGSKLQVAVDACERFFRSSNISVDFLPHFRYEVERLKRQVALLVQRQEIPHGKVSWQLANIYCKRVTGTFPDLQVTLPTEAQWEYACRAGTTTAFNDGSDCTVPDGNDPVLDRLGWFRENSGGAIHPVRQRQPNAWGLYDMHGNVWEWCRDRWDQGAYGKRARIEVVDPLVISVEAADRVLRGGSWNSNARDCRSAKRFRSEPSKSWDNFGLRLCAAHEPRAAEMEQARLPFNPQQLSGVNEPAAGTDAAETKGLYSDATWAEFDSERDFTALADSLEKKFTTKKLRRNKKGRKSKP
jgi:formylglycine-generating enzyme required for sulfatase activity